MKDKRLLVVAWDGDRLSRKWKLHELGPQYEVQFAEDLNSAGIAVDRNRPDAILLDVYASGDPPLQDLPSACEHFRHGDSPLKTVILIDCADGEQSVARLREQFGIVLVVHGRDDLRERLHQCLQPAVDVGVVAGWVARASCPCLRAGPGSHCFRR